MDLEHAFTFIWKDENWSKKLGIATILMFTVIGSIAVIGWIAELAKRVAHHKAQPIPDWEELVDYFRIGLRYLGITVIWSFPVIVVIIGMAILIAPTTLMDDPSQFLAVVWILNICIFIFVFFYLVGIVLLTPALWVLLAEGKPFNELINPTHAWTLLKSNFGGYLIATLVGWLITAILSSFGLLACVVGVFFASVLSQMVVAFLTGQATAQARSNIASTPTIPLI
ncbi:MAG TPA: DUF4013 domain-containing protein [Anaerolineales bacterium]|jgi:hypothetical protein|nr:DUF4013 domain-containing protein [Anaerolineales bacterium]